MNAGLVTLWCATIGLAGSALVYNADRYVAARSASQDKVHECRVIAGGLRELQALKHAGGPLASPASTDEGLAEAVSQTLAEVGLPSTTLESLVPDLGATGSSGSPILTADGQRTDAMLRCARASLVLQDLTLPRLGAFIDAFARRRPGWRLTTIDIARDRDAKVTPGEDLPIRAVLSLETLAITTPGEQRR